MGRRFPDGGLLRYRKWVLQQLGDINKQGSGDSPPIGVRHGNTAANHTDLQSGCGRTCVFAVQAWLNLWDPISEPPSHYSMGLVLYVMQLGSPRPVFSSSLIQIFYLMLSTEHSTREIKLHIFHGVIWSKLHFLSMFLAPTLSATSKNRRAAPAPAAGDTVMSN